MNLRKVLILTLVIILTVSLAACGGKGNKSTGDDGDVLVEVGEVKITEEDFRQYMYVYSFLQGVNLSGASEEELEYIEELVLEDYISLNLIKLELADDLDVLPENYEDMAKGFLDEVKGHEQSAAYMEEYKISDDYLKKFYEDQYYNTKFFTYLTGEIPEATDEEAKSFYDQNPEDFIIDEVTASHILVEDKALAEDILSKLKNGDDFGELAAEHSIDGSAANGGSLGTFGKGMMVKEFEEASFSLEPGEISDIVETDFGFHIIFLEEKHQGQEKFEDVKDAIIEAVDSKKIKEAYDEKIEALRKKYGVEYKKK